MVNLSILYFGLVESYRNVARLRPAYTSKNEGERQRSNPFAAMFANNRRKGTDAKRPANPFAGFFAGSYGNDSTFPKPSFTFNLGIPKTQRIINQSFDFREPVSYHFYRVSMSARSAEDWRFGSLDLYKDNSNLKMAPSHTFRSAWMSAGTGQEWIYVDLGDTSTLDNFKF